jgi:hypothetical protein
MTTTKTATKIEGNKGKDRDVQKSDNDINVQRNPEMVEDGIRTVVHLRAILAGRVIDSNQANAIRSAIDGPEVSVGTGIRSGTEECAQEHCGKALNQIAHGERNGLTLILGQSQFRKDKR